MFWNQKQKCFEISKKTQTFELFFQNKTIQLPIFVSFNLWKAISEPQTGIERFPETYFCRYHDSQMFG